MQMCQLVTGKSASKSPSASGPINRLDKQIVTTPTSPVLMGLDYVKENKPNMWEKWAPQRRVETGVQSVQSTRHFDTGVDNHFNQPGH